MNTSRNTARLALAALFFLATPALAAVLAGWDVHSQAGGSNSFGASPLAASSTDPNLTVGGLTRGSGVGTTGTAAARGWGGNGWTSSTAAAAVSANDSFSFTVTAKPGYQVSLSSISRFDYRRSSSGPVYGVLQFQIGSGSFSDVSTLSYTNTAKNGASLTAIDLSSIAALQNVAAGTTVTFRVANYGGSSQTGSWYVFDTANTTSADLEVSGTVSVSGPVNGVCGSANGQTFAAIPSTNLCVAGTPSTVVGAGPWTWSCTGLNGGSTASCAANTSVIALCPAP